MKRSEEISAQKATITKMMHQKYLLTVSEGNTYFFAVVIETDFDIRRYLSNPKVTEAIQQFLKIFAEMIKISRALQREKHNVF